MARPTLQTEATYLADGRTAVWRVPFPWRTPDDVGVKVVDSAGLETVLAVGRDCMLRGFDVFTFVPAGRTVKIWLKADVSEILNHSGAPLPDPAPAFPWTPPCPPAPPAPAGGETAADAENPGPVYGGAHPGPCGCMRGQEAPAPQQEARYYADGRTARWHVPFAWRRTTDVAVKVVDGEGVEHPLVDGTDYLLAGQFVYAFVPEGRTVVVYATVPVDGEIPVPSQPPADPCARLDPPPLDPSVAWLLASVQEVRKMQDGGIQMFWTAAGEAVEDCKAAVLEDRHAAAASAEAAAGSAASAAGSAETAETATHYLFNHGVLGFQTKALLDADLDHDANALAFVTNDPAPANNNWYIKLGASGTGSWQASGFNPATSAEADALEAGKADKVDGAVAGNVAMLDASGNLADSTIASANVALKTETDVIEASVAALSTGKADKVADAFAGDIAILDASGDLVDSGVKPEDKADKVAWATAGHLASLDATGNLLDSGEPASAIDILRQSKANKVDNAAEGNLAGLDNSGNLVDSGESVASFKSYTDAQSYGEASRSFLPGQPWERLFLDPQNPDRAEIILSGNSGVVEQINSDGSIKERLCNFSLFLAPERPESDAIQIDETGKMLSERDAWQSNFSLFLAPERPESDAIQIDETGKMLSERDAWQSNFSLFLAPERPESAFVAVDEAGKVAYAEDAVPESFKLFLFPGQAENTVVQMSADGVILCDSATTSAVVQHSADIEMLQTFVESVRNNDRESPFFWLFLDPERMELRDAVVADGDALVATVSAEGGREVYSGDELKVFLVPGHQTNDVVFLTEDGKIVSDVDGFGVARHPGSVCWPVPYISSGSVMKADMQGPSFVARLSAGSPVQAVYPQRADCWRIVANGRAGSLTDEGFFVPDLDAHVLHCFVSIGQSLCVGAKGSPLVLSQPPVEGTCLMLAGDTEMDIRMNLDTRSLDTISALDPATLTGFQNVRAGIGVNGSNRGQTMDESAAYALATAEGKTGHVWKSLWICSGVGGTAYSGLKKESTSYDNTLVAVEKAKTLAEAEGLSLVVEALLLKHGEGDSGNANYYMDLIEWQSDYESDIKAITGQTKDIPMVIAMQSSFTSGKNSVSAMLRAHEDSQKHWVASVDYPFPYSDDLLHLSGPGYHFLGETMINAAMEAAFFGGCDCVRMLSASRRGNEVTVTFSVPFPPLAFDTALVPQRNGTLYGFTYEVDGVRLVVTDARIADAGASGTATVVLTLERSPSGSEEVLQMAWDGQSSPRTEENIPRGNVRDSAGDRRKSTYDGRRLDNWAVHQQIAVSIQ